MTFFLNVYVFGNKYKSVFSFLRQLTTWHCSQLLLSAGRAAISWPPVGPTAANPPQDAVDGWDRQTNRRTDTVPLHRPGRILARSVNNLLFALILDAVHCVNKMKTGLQTVLFGQYFTIILCTKTKAPFANLPRRLLERRQPADRCRLATNVSHYVEATTNTTERWNSLLGKNIWPVYYTNR